MMKNHIRITQVKVMKSKLPESFGSGNVGYGKNYHTTNPEPVDWEKLSEIDYFLTSMPDGSFLAGVSLPGTGESSLTYKFNSEQEAMFWLKQTSEKYTSMKSNQEY